MLNVGKNIITDSLIFHYDMKDQTSYKGEPTYNIFYDGSLMSHGFNIPLPYAGYDYNDSSVYKVQMNKPYTRNNFGVNCHRYTDQSFYELNSDTKYITASFYANVKQIINSSIGNFDKGYLLVEYTDGSLISHSNYRQYYKHNVTPPLAPAYWFNILSNDFVYYEIRYTLDPIKTPKGVRAWHIYNDWCSTGYVDIYNLQLEEKPYATNYTLQKRDSSVLYDIVSNTPLYTDVKYEYNNIFYFNESRIVTNNIPINSSNWTIEFIVKPYNMQDPLMAYVLINPSNGKFNEISILNSGTVRFVYGDSSLYTIESNANMLNISNYNLVHLTLDSNNVLSTYFNGQFDCSQNLLADSNLQSIWNLGLIINPSSYRSFIGELPMMSVYNKVLDSNEVYQNYIAYKGSYNFELSDYIKDGLVMYLDGINNSTNYHDSSASKWYDLSGNGNDMNVYNGIWSKDCLCYNGVNTYFKEYFKTPLNSPSYTIETYYDDIANNDRYQDILEFGTSTGGTGFGIVKNKDRMYGWSNYDSAYDPSNAFILLKNTNINRPTLRKTYYALIRDNSNAYLNINNVINSSVNFGDHPLNINSIYSGRDNPGITPKRHSLLNMHAVRVYNRTLSNEELEANYVIDCKRFSSPVFSVNVTSTSEKTYFSLGLYKASTVVVYWGDGTYNIIQAPANVLGSRQEYKHTYTSIGIYDITIITDFSNIHFINGANFNDFYPELSKMNNLIDFYPLESQVKSGIEYLTSNKLRSFYSYGKWSDNNIFNANILNNPDVTYIYTSYCPIDKCQFDKVFTNNLKLFSIQANNIMSINFKDANINNLREFALITIIRSKNTLYVYNFDPTKFNGPLLNSFSLMYNNDISLNLTGLATTGNNIKSLSIQASRRIIWDLSGVRICASNAGFSIPANESNIYGDITNLYTYPINGGQHWIWNQSGITGDITNWVFNRDSSWINPYWFFHFSWLSNLRGDISNWKVPYNNFKLDLQWSKITGLNNYIRGLFNDRLLMNKSYITSIVLNNISESPTGIYQQGSISPYMGSIHNLTETQIDEVSSSWTTKEIQWWLHNAQISSSDTTKRYNITITL